MTECDPYRITYGIFSDLEQKNLKMYVQTQKIPKSQSSHEKEKQLEESSFLTSDNTIKIQ